MNEETRIIFMIATRKRNKIAKKKKKQQAAAPETRTDVEKGRKNECEREK